MKEKYTSCSEIPSMKKENLKVPERGGNKYSNSITQMGIWLESKIIFLGFPCGSADKESACSVGDLGSIPGLGRSPGDGKGYPLQYSGLEHSMDSTVCGSQSRTRLSATFTHILPSGVCVCLDVRTIIPTSVTLCRKGEVR